MAGPLFYDRTQENSATTGTGTYTLSGATTGYQAWSVVGNGNTAYYMATDGNGWEVGLGTYTLSGTTLARTTILASSNANAAVNWSAGTRTISLVDSAKALTNMVPFVASRTIMAGLSTTQTTSVFLQEAGRQGTFVWNSANLSTQVTSDTQQGIYVPPSSDTTGASGAWVRSYNPGQYYGSWFGVLGDGSTDDTTALQAAINFLPQAGGVFGGTLFLNGNIIYSTISLLSKVDINIVGTGNINTGSGTSTILDSSSTTAGRVIDCRGTAGITFEGIEFVFRGNPGKGFDFGRSVTPVADASGMSMKNCSIIGSGTTASTVVLSLDGATRGRFDHCYFVGKGNLVFGRISTGFGFSNVMTFLSCNFGPGSSSPAVQNPGTAWSFIGCTFEASNSDGIQRGIYGSSGNPCDGLVVSGCYFGDATANGGQCMSLYGAGLSVTGCYIGNFSNSGNYGINLNAGFNGASICGNEFISCGFAVIVGTSCTNIDIRGNTLTSVGALLSGTISSGVVATASAGLGRASAFNYLYTFNGNNGIAISTPTTTGVVTAIDFDNSANTQCGAINVDQGAHTTSYGTSSDARGKEFRTPLTGALDAVNNMAVYDYRDERNQIRGIGLVAQEVYAVHPEAVVPGDEKYDKWSPDQDGWQMWMLDNSKLIPYALAAIKELSDQVIELQKKIDGKT